MCHFQYLDMWVCLPPFRFVFILYVDKLHGNHMLEVKKEMEVRREVLCTSFPAPTLNLSLSQKLGRGLGNEAEVYV